LSRYKNQIEMETVLEPQKRYPGVAYDENDMPAGMTLEEFSAKLDDRLSAHYGTDMRELRAKLVAEGKIAPLPF
jgi:hypothetical protein